MEMIQALGLNRACRKTQVWMFFNIQIALTEKWAEAYKGKGIGFYSMHPGWAETPGVASSMPGFSKTYA